MADERWRVDYSDAYRVWVGRRRPTVEQETDLVAWLSTCEIAGPPTATRDEKDNHEAIGPDGIVIYFRSEANPVGDPGGFIYVMQIG